MRIYWILCLLLVSSTSWSQSSDTLTVRSEVSAVTVFLQGAQSDNLHQREIIRKNR